MDFDADNNSIFSSPGKGNEATPPPFSGNVPDLPDQNSALNNFFNSIKQKLDNAKTEKTEKEMHDGLVNLIESNSDVLLILKSFDCKMNFIDNNTIEVVSKELNLKGQMRINKDTVELDDNCKQLFDVITQIISGGYRLDDILAKYESEEYYPIGEVVPVEINYKGTKITASKGMLVNPKGETKTITFYKGYEILSDEELEEREKEQNNPTD